MGKRVKIAFADMDGTVETLWASVVGHDWYRVENTPFFIYGVSLGDVVQASWRPEDLRQEEGGVPYFERVVEKSGNRTLRLALVRAVGDDDDPEADFTPACTVDSDEGRATLDRLGELGCSCERFPPYLLAINVPAGVPLDPVMGFLESTGLKWENGDPRGEDVPGRAYYEFRLVERGEDQLGGSPRGVDSERWLECEDCRSPMAFVLLLGRHHRRLRLARHGAVALFHCVNHEGEQPRPAHNAVLLLDPEQLASEPGGLVGAGPLRRRQLRYSREVEANPWASGSHRMGSSPVNKVGGYPRWRGEERTPLCAVCGQPMALVAQLDGGLDPDLHLDGRVGYLFVCPDEHEGRFLLLD